jgi:ABC-type molybdenum transport system ATPase subunit/photorepair protein PhrA
LVIKSIDWPTSPNSSVPADLVYHIRPATRPERDNRRSYPSRVGGRGLELKGITQRYGDLVAVCDLSLDVQPGEVFGFVGSNGAGKTTTMSRVKLADAWRGKA